MAGKKREATEKLYKISVEGNKDYCGIDAGGVQFAHGEAIISDGRMVEWFKEHEGYHVAEIEPSTPTDSAE